MREQLVAVTDAQNRYVASKNIGVDIGTTGLINTSGATRNDDAFTRTQTRDRCLTRLNVCVDAKLAYFSRNQMSVLPACIENGYLGHDSRSGLLN